ncbi:MAG: hypothetical protein J5526_09395, partial [Bacteroidales bacterium]|nr:hypothetical protein [Bacteroidales bacterium]
PMCTVTINIDEARLRSINPELDGTEAISRWLQENVDLWMSQHAPAKSTFDPSRLHPDLQRILASRPNEMSHEKDKSTTLDQFYGVWSDDRIDADAFIAELKSARTFKRETIE